MGDGGWNGNYITDAHVVHSKEISDNNVKKRKKERKKKISRMEGAIFER